MMWDKIRPSNIRIKANKMPNLGDVKRDWNVYDIVCVNTKAKGA